ncbi:uncharacterized protein LOC133884170 [Phragmites australis]|uniref:uncharacterized protein LOC133884170 n=1 Tax=Phragmites australis TaxID=29695 RepID=UPI002D77F9E5|nr:uncharacterized protein LOC133884170 [Phragmites australis]
MADPKPKNPDEAKEMEEDDSLLKLSLGSIVNNPAAARACSTALADDCSPVTLAMPIPLRPVVVLSAAFVDGTAAHTSSVPTGASAPAVVAPHVASPVVQVNCSDAFLAPDVLRPTDHQVSSLLPPLFPSDGNGVVPVHGDVNAAPPAQRKGVVPSATSPASKEASAPPKKRPRVTNRSSPSTASDHAAANNGLSPADNGNGPRGREAPTDGSLIESPPFPWATDRIVVHHSLAELLERGIDTIVGEVHCKRCDMNKTIAFDIKAKFNELYNFIARNIQTMHDRAPSEWLYPTLQDCDECGQENSLRPVIAAEKEKINWLFLLLGQTLGLCTLEQLRHFCEHTNQHRSGAKDRLVYSTYMELCRQLYPDGPFDMALERKNRSLPFA